MITRVEIKNYRSIAHADVTMKSLTVLVGRNGAGKSSFVDALKFVRDALQFGLERAVIQRNGFASIRRWAPRRKRQVEIVIEVERGKSFEGRYELILGSDGDGFKIVREKASYRQK